MDKGNCVKRKNKSDSIWDPFLQLCIPYSVAFAIRIVAYCLKHTGWPILKALTFKDIIFFHSYVDKTLQNREQRVLLKIHRNTMTWPMWTIPRTEDSDTKKSASVDYNTITLFSIKEARILTQGKMVLWDTSPPSSGSVDFSNKVSIPCPNNLSFDLLACREVSSKYKFELSSNSTSW